uniref:Uncharacterized protein n=1 Tax=Candidatus Kentrum sp. FW TaxID=2126338 RepID=A0A450TCF7_9GAMM|nr:MAG: hypothetical protein BECKFW1821C_GA0114237_100611 [Candidatus Kentron sp. FW]
MSFIYGFVPKKRSMVRIGLLLLVSALIAAAVHAALPVISLNSPVSFPVDI